ncbi:MAG: T9SS type A sorting domain-containing protein [candidate division Zixibacteria bacterium]|nr:T9SS type A sorting domain-containing protein [candidate division Zixibacteria bacterium]
MKLKTLMLMALILAIPAMLIAQDYTVQDFRDAEYKMKSEHWQKMQESMNSDITLDQADFDVKYWELNIDVTDIAGQTVTGNVTMTSQSVVDGLTEVDYDLHSNMVAESVLMDGEPVAFSHSDHILTITLDQTYNEGDLFTTEVYYNGHPAGGGLGSFAWEEHNGHPIIATLSEPIGAREWWPCKDIPHDKADSSDVLITVDEDLVATSNGLLISNTDNEDGTRTFHWHNSYPITTYLISMAISNYAEFTDWYVYSETDSMPIVNYVYPEHLSAAEEDLNITAAAMEFFAGLFGEYPFINEKYGHSIFTWGGAMEHQCNTSYGQGLIRGDHAYDWILVHELAHQWFGDMINCDTWPNIWMNEGFASYLEALWAEHLYGFEAYRDYMVYNNDVSDPSGPIYDPDELFSGNTVYDKGSWVLHMLRGVMGDEAFFEGMYAYANDPRYQYGTITTQEFQALMEEYYDAPLDWYFDEWLWGMNRPWYGYSWLTEDIGNGQWEVFLHIRQAQPAPAPEVFTMPIQVFPRINGVDTMITVFNDSRIDDLRFIVNGEPTAVGFDMHDFILKMAYNQGYTMNIVTTELPNGFEEMPYSHIIESRGGEAPYTYTVTEGSLPAGMELDAATGELSGVPEIWGEYAFTIESNDSSNPQLTDEQEFDFLVEEAIGIEDNVNLIPVEFELHSNYPNPFNNSTVISFNLTRQSDVSLDIYNVLGQQVANLHSGQLSAGHHNFLWTGDSVPSGVYFYKLTADDKTEVQKMTLLK